MGAGTIRVAIADDHAVLRAGLRMLIEGQQDMEVVAEAGDARGAVRKVLETEPDVLILDMAMPGGGSIEAIKKIRDECEKTRVLVLSMYDDQTYLRSVIDAGGSGYVAKRAADSALLTAIRTVHEGRTYVDVSLKGDADATPPPRPAAPDISVLSPRELEVLRLLALGHTNREIAEQLGIGVKSVDTYRGRLTEKLELKSRAELVRYALGVGLMDPRGAPPHS